MDDLTKKKMESSLELAKKIKEFTSRQKEIKEIKKEIPLSPSLNIAFLFDTTGSMYEYFSLGKKAIRNIMNKVNAEVKNVKFCYIAYKNHSDEHKFFDGQHPFFATTLTENVIRIKELMDKVNSGGGGDGLTALEDVFHHLNTQTNWNDSASKAVVIIGDMPPHGVIDGLNKCPYGYNYKEEIEELIKKGIKVYSVFCYKESELASTRKQKVQAFYKNIAQLTNGRYLELAEINDLVDLLIAICMKETGRLEKFIIELKSSKKLTASKEKLLLRLKGEQLK